MGLAYSKAEFEKMRKEMFDFCLAHLPEDLDISLIMDNQFVLRILWDGLSTFRQRHRFELQAIHRNLMKESHKWRDFILHWLVACNDSVFIRSRTRLHPDRDLETISAPEFRREIEDQYTSKITTSRTGSPPPKEAQLHPVSQETDTAQNPQPTMPSTQTRSTSPSLAEVKVEEKRSIELVEDTDDEAVETRHKTIVLSVSDRPLPSRVVSPQPVTVAPSSWGTIILHFKVMDSGIDDAKANNTRIPLRKFFYDPQQSTTKINPYELNFADLAKHIHNTTMGQTLDLQRTYARLAGDAAEPALFDDGELGVMLMKWDALKPVHDNFDAMVVELWKSLKTFSTVKG